MSPEAADALDTATAARDGEQLDAEAIAAYLADHAPELAGRVTVQQFPGGKSNLTYLVTVGSREYVLRRPPFGTKAKSAHDMGREYRVLSRLSPVFPLAPTPAVYCEDESVIGAPFYLMERVRGIILRREPPTGMTIDPDLAQRLSEELIDRLADLHRVDVNAAGLDGIGRPAGYVQRQINGWNDRFRRARTPDVPDCEDVMAWLEDRKPPDSGHVALIHNDYKFDNIILAPEAPHPIIGILDWEMATVGDPLMDLGCALSYWIQDDDPPSLQAIRQGPTLLPGMLRREALLARYCQRTGFTVDDFPFYYAYGLFRLAVIAQQIYYRYYHGQTQDARFKAFGQFAEVLGNAVRETMQRDGDGD